MKPDIPTGKIEVCKYCDKPIAQVRDPISGALDWYSNGYDTGCDSSPDTTQDGTGSHEPDR
jgi:hypothetical protein